MHFGTRVGFSHRLARAECIAASLESQLLAVGKPPDYRYLPNTKPSEDLRSAIGQPLLDSADAIVKSSKMDASEEIARSSRSNVGSTSPIAFKKTRAATPEEDF